jgi:predicted RNase H-like HicB family nuclease
MKKEFLVVFEVGKTSVGAFAPDIPGYFAVGSTLDETRPRFLEAAEAHLEWMVDDHDPIPEPVTTTFDFTPAGGAEKSSFYVEWLAISVSAGTLRAISA